MDAQTIDQANGGNEATTGARTQCSAWWRHGRFREPSASHNSDACRFYYRLQLPMRFRLNSSIVIRSSLAAILIRPRLTNWRIDPGNMVCCSLCSSVLDRTAKLAIN